jgi:Zn finger protein HypA/HybF involved in hydrogenase expression
MWNCKVCNAEVEDDSWDVCWRCSTPRNLAGAALIERQRTVQAKINPPSPVKCVRCGHSMKYGGTKKFHEGSRQWGFWMGDLGELFVHREHYDIYACPHCGKLEFFVDGIGDALRGEHPADE